MSAISAPQYTIYISMLEFAVLLLIYNFYILCKERQNAKGCQFLHKNLGTTVYDRLSTATSASKLIISNKVNRIKIVG